MNRFKFFLFNAASAIKEARNCMRRFRLAAPVALAGVLLVAATQAQSPEPFSFDLTPSIPNCFQNATAKVTVFPKEDLRGVDTLDLKAKGLPPNTSFTVFLTELPDLPFGATQYIGEFTTNAEGRGSLRVNTIIEEAFSSTTDSGPRLRKELNHVVIWFADPADDDSCFGPGAGPKTPFDGDGEAGAAVLSSKNFLPDAPLP
jgi:hypothetical protein